MKISSNINEVFFEEENRVIVCPLTKEIIADNSLTVYEGDKESSLIGYIDGEVYLIFNREFKRELQENGIFGEHEETLKLAEKKYVVIEFEDDTYCPTFF